MKRKIMKIGQVPLLAGHGYVIPRADGTRHDCGGPLHCLSCDKEALSVYFADATQEIRMARLGGPMISFEVEGNPVPMQRVRFSGIRKRVFTPAKSMAYRVSVAWAARKATPMTWPRGKGFEYGLSLMVCYDNKTRRDLDYVVKAVMDACNGIVWDDDSQVSSLVVQRRYVETKGRLSAVARVLV